MTIKLVIAGCCGRMGRAIGTLTLADGAFAIGAALEGAGHPDLGHDYGTVLGRAEVLRVPVVDDARQALARGDVLVEFSTPEATVAHVQAAAELGKPAVIGTTGLSDTQQAAVRTASTRVAVVLSPNMSVGVNLLFELAQAAVKRLGAGFDAEIVEAHHRGKKDAPSGTAKRLAEVIAAARAGGGPVPVHAIRAGDIAGDHTVVLAGPSERLELTHRAQNRDVFARGALRAAQFVRTAAPGLYDMSHVLGAAGRA